MTSIIWYIYNEALKKEHELLEKMRKKERDRLERTEILERIPARLTTRNNPEKLLNTKIYRNIHEKFIACFFAG